MIQVTAKGYLTEDPTLRDTNSGTAVCNYRMGCKSLYADRTTFIDGTLWGDQAELFAKSHQKGSPVVIAGGAELQHNDWENNDGETVRSYKINGGNFEFAGPKGETVGGQDSGQSDTTEDIPEDEVPF